MIAMQGEQLKFGFEGDQLRHSRDGKIADEDGNIYDESGNLISETPSEYLQKAMEIARRTYPDITANDPLVKQYARDLRRDAEKKKPKQ